MSTRRRLAPALCTALLLATPALALVEHARIGERFYLSGLAESGVPVATRVQGDLRLPSTGMPCVNCHRRSAWGTSEGRLTVPPITRDVLFAPVTRGSVEMGTVRTTGAGTRPAYTDESLLRALRDGIDPSGRTLSDTMPRYDLSAADARAIGAYLRSLAGAPPGVTDSTIHLATVLTPAAPAAARDSMLEVLRTYVSRMNAGTRNETRRRQRGPWDMKQHYENYRTWVIHEWALQGDQRDWGRQLRERYTREPVFALVAGISDGDWSAVHEFSAEFKVPVVLPQTPLPPSHVEDPFYSLYFSRGVMLEAETLAARLAGDRETPVSIVQVARCGTPGESAARALAGRVGPGIGVAPIDCVAPGAALDGPTWARLLQRRATTAVLWLSADDLPGLRTLADDPRLLQAFRSVYLSSTLLGEEAERLSGELGRRGLLLQPFVPAAEFPQQLWRAMAWFRANQIDPADRRVAVNTLFAMTLVADVLMIPRTLASREYFIERLEHMASSSPNRSAYPALSFDAVRRFGTDECSVLALPAAEAALSGR